MRDLASISMDLAEVLPGFKQIDGDWKRVSCHGNIILLQL